MPVCSFDKKTAAHLAGGFFIAAWQQSAALGLSFNSLCFMLRDNAGQMLCIFANIFCTALNLVQLCTDLVAINNKKTGYQLA